MVLMMVFRVIIYMYVLWFGFDIFIGYVFEIYVQKVQIKMKREIYFFMYQCDLKFEEWIFSIVIIQVMSV